MAGITGCVVDDQARKRGRATCRDEIVRRVVSRDILGQYTVGPDLETQAMGLGLVVNRSGRVIGQGTGKRIGIRAVAVIRKSAGRGRFIACLHIGRGRTAVRRVGLPFARGADRRGRRQLCNDKADRVGGQVLEPETEVVAQAQSDRRCAAASRDVDALNLDIDAVGIVIGDCRTRGRAWSPGRAGGAGRTGCSRRPGRAGRTSGAIACEQQDACHEQSCHTVGADE